MSNANRRRLEDNLAVIFMAIVLFFLISHFPRIILGLQGRLFRLVECYLFSTFAQGICYAVLLTVTREKM